MRKAIVTGANGFVGAAVCKELIYNNVDVIAIIRSSDSDIRRLSDVCNKIKILYCDLSDFSKLDDLIPDRDVDAFYHFAWSGSAGNLRSDLEIQIDNVRHTCDTVKACASLNCKRFVFAASLMEYEIEAVMETASTPRINTLYCIAKITADYMARTLAGSLGIDYIRGVISNIYGPGETSPRLINTSLKKLLRGEHCSFSAGEQIYDFIYITDAAKIFVKLGDAGKANKTYYIGSSKPRPLKEFLVEMRDCVDPSVNIGLGELPFNGVSLTYKEFDINAVKFDTGFVPEVPFRMGITKTIEWLKRQELKL